MTPQTTTGGFLLVLAMGVPLLSVLLAVGFAGRQAGRVAWLAGGLGLAVAAAIGGEVWRTGEAVVYLMGGWAPPLGLALRADGLSATMLLTTAGVIAGVGIFARETFAQKPGEPEARRPLVFWVLLMAVWAGMNAVFLGHDLFNLYVALEVLTFAAVPLVCLDGRTATLQAALRYLLFALLGSALYLLGLALLYGAYGTLDLTLLAGRARRDAVTGIAVAVLTVGLMAKTALFPLHFWLPPAHAGAPPAASAVLSALVVKGSFFILMRIWFEGLPELATTAAAQVVGGCGAAAIVFGGVLALRQTRLKMLIAYSTVAQIGYLFLMFPMATAGSAALVGGFFQVISHALAKAALFLGAGLVVEVVGHDRLTGLRGMFRVLPLTVLAFGLAAMSLLGVPPTGGFVAKWLLLTAAMETGQWWWAVVIFGGGLLAGGYLFRLVAPMLADAGETIAGISSVAKTREAVVLALAVGAVLVGVFPEPLAALLEIGQTAREVGR